MESNHVKLRELKHQIALVQGELFRCVAVETTPGRWTKAQDGTELPRVLEVLRVIGQCDSEFLGKRRF